MAGKQPYYNPIQCELNNTEQNKRLVLLSLKVESKDDIPLDVVYVNNNVIPLDVVYVNNNVYLQHNMMSM
jgi:hypothetical protein